MTDWDESIAATEDYLERVKRERASGELSEEDYARATRLIRQLVGRLGYFHMMANKPLDEEALAEAKRVGELERLIHHYKAQRSDEWNANEGRRYLFEDIATNQDVLALCRWGLAALARVNLRVIDGLAENPNTPREVVVALVQSRKLRKKAKTSLRAVEALEKLLAHPSMVLGENLEERAWLEGEIELIREEYEKGRDNGTRQS